MKNSKLKILTTFHHSYAGGSKSASRLFHYLSKDGCTVNGYFFETPQYFTYTPGDVRVFNYDEDGLHSEVIDSKILKTYLAVRKIVKDAKSYGCDALVGFNLFPYANILLEAKQQLVVSEEKPPKLVVHPVGSDIWQIGPQIKERVQWLLDNPVVDVVLTYSKPFADEIKNYYDIRRDIRILPPVIEHERFFPLADSIKGERRKVLGFSPEDFIIHHHSTLRKVKCPEVVIEIANRVSEKIPTRCVLVMSGPVPDENLTSIHGNLSLAVNRNPLLKFKSKCGKLLIYWTGILSEVEYLLQISDAELNSSLHDSFNISLQEAMACGIPVVSSDVVGIKEHILISKGGFCFPTRRLEFDELQAELHSKKEKNALFDIEAAVEALTYLAGNRDEARRIGQAGARYASIHFSADYIINRFHQLIEGRK